MQQLTDILLEATAAIPANYFLLPIHGGNSVYRERVYCYELYHQMRLLWPASTNYCLNGEVDKRSHPYFQIAGGQPKPDLLVHEPSTRRNHAVVEVKSSRASAVGIRKDLDTLCLFRNECGYERAIYLVYGPDDVRARLQNCGAAVSAPIEVWLHPAPHLPATFFHTLA